MDLVFLGVSKSGTFSLYEFFKQHPQIAVSPTKEYLLDKAIHFEKNNINFNVDEYISGFNITKNTKILLDGATNTSFPWMNPYTSILSKYFNIKYIHIIRNPIDRMLSFMNYRIQTKEYEEIEKQRAIGINYFNVDGSLRIEKSASFTISNSDIASLMIAELLYGRKNIFIAKFKDIIKNPAMVFPFLDIVPFGKKLKHINKGVIHDEKITKYVRKNLDMIKKISVENLMRVQSFYNIDLSDMIKEVEERKI